MKSSDLTHIVIAERVSQTLKEAFKAEASGKSLPNPGGNSYGARGGVSRPMGGPTSGYGNMGSMGRGGSMGMGMGSMGMGMSMSKGKGMGMGMASNPLSPPKNKVQMW